MVTLYNPATAVRILAVGIGAAIMTAPVSGFTAFLALTLLALLDLRRGFLLTAYPLRSPFFVFHPAHVLLFACGMAGMFVCYVRLRRVHGTGPGSSRHVAVLTGAIAALLVADLFAYRAVPAARSIAAGRINVDWLQAFGATGWWRPIAQATSYLFTVWHATMLGILLSGLALAALPAAVNPYLVRRGFRGSLLGALFALPPPFCSCCSSVMAPSLVRRGASPTFLLSFVVGAPMLNVTTMALAVALLPARFAVARLPRASPSRSSSPTRPSVSRRAGSASPVRWSRRAGHGAAGWHASEKPWGACRGSTGSWAASPQIRRRG
jgi:hypothetical protein